MFFTPWVHQDLDLSFAGSSDAKASKVGPDGTRSRMLLVTDDADVKTEGIPWLTTRKCFIFFRNSRVSFLQLKQTYVLQLASIL